MAKLYYISVLITGGCALVSLLIVVLFVILQVTVNSRNTPVPFSVIVGGDKRINYQGDSCHNIELNSFTPNIPTVAYLTSASSIVITKSLEQVLVNHSLQVGYDPNQLTYYGVPVSKDDEVNLYVRASSISPEIQSATVLVYDVEGFRQFLNYTTTNAAPISTYSLGMGCLQTVSGCTVSSVVRLEGWLYFVFVTTPTPSNLIVTLEATVRDYDIDLTEINAECTLYGSSSRCFLEVPNQVIYNNDNNNNVHFLPFTITYETSPLISNTSPSSQSLNVSVDLSWTCSLTYLNNFIITFSLFSGVFVIAVGSLVFIIFTKCAKKNYFSFSLPSINCPKRTRNNTYRTASTTLHLETITETSDAQIPKSCVRFESLPPAYDKVVKADIGPEDELPYYQHTKD